MSVQSEITRIESAKTAIATAIEGKGVAVPEGTKLDGLAALVESIEAGGGKIARGEFTLSEDVRNYTVQHNLGVTPNFAVLSYNFSYGTSTQNRGYACFAYSNGQNGVYRSTGNLSASNASYALTDTTALSNYNSGRFVVMCNRANETAITFGYFDDNNHNLMLKGGNGSYLWIVGVVE